MAEIGFGRLWVAHPRARPSRLGGLLVLLDTSSADEIRECGRHTRREY